jgi:hypothetical protein
MAKQVARVFPFRQSALTFSVLLSAALFGGFTVQAQQLQTSQPQAPQLIADTSSDFSTSAPLPGEPIYRDASLEPTPHQALQPPDQYDHVDGQSKRIFGIIPNFRAVNADVHLPPQTVREKFVTASQDSFDYSSVFIPVAVAAYDYGRNATPEFGSGGVAYGRYLWHSAVDQTVENYMVEFFVPAAFHEDTRYYTLARGGFARRAGYSLSRIVVTRSDSGRRVFNFGEVLGAGAGAGISNLYYPSRERTFGNTGTQWGTSIAIDAAGFFVKEFSPDISHALFHAGKAFHLPGSKSN